MNTALLVALIAAVAGPLVAYIAAARRLSGKIGTSEASDLWAESKSIREDARVENRRLQARIEQLEKRLAEGEHRVAKLEENNSTLTQENSRLTMLVRKLEAEALR